MEDFRISAILAEANCSTSCWTMGEVGVGPVSLEKGRPVTRQVSSATRNRRPNKTPMMRQENRAKLHLSRGGSGSFDWLFSWWIVPELRVSDQVNALHHGVSTVAAQCHDC
jgi:hypothetical protein